MAAGRTDVSRRRGYNKGDYGIVVRKNGCHASFDLRRNGFSCGREEPDIYKLWNGDCGPHCSSKFEDGEMAKAQLPSDKKRKFSPIVWDLEDQKGRISSNKKVAHAPPPLPPSKSFRQGLNVVSDDADERYPVLENWVIEVGLVSDKTCVTQRLADGTDVEASAILSPLLAEEKNGDYDEELDEREDGVFAEAQNISMSRWALDNDSPRGATFFDEEGIHGGTLYKKKSSPESGECPGEVSDRDRSRSFGSDGRQCSVGSASRDNSEGRLEHDVMDLDEIQHDNVNVNEMESDCDSSLIEEPASATQRSVSLLRGCRSVFEYERLNEINEGTYGKVFRARDKKTGEIVALKKVKMNIGRDRSLEEYGFPFTALREINILLSFNHPSIVRVKEVVMGDLDNVFMVMEYMEHDLKELMQVMKQPFSTSEVKCLVLQLLEGVKYLHDNWVLHRDLKTSNLLYNNKGELKICDFGMSRQYGSPWKPYTSLVVTLWYRAPELLLGAKQYSTAVDMWSVGCIMAELLAKEPLYQGKSEIDQLNKIFKTLGTPNETIWPGLSKLPGAKANFTKQPFNMLRKKFPAASFTGSTVLSDLGFDLLNKLLTYDPEQRITADDALNHPWFNEVPLPKSREFMPTFPPQYAKNRHLERTIRSPDLRRNGGGKVNSQGKNNAELSWLKFGKHRL